MYLRHRLPSLLIETALGRLDAKSEEAAKELALRKMNSADLAATSKIVRHRADNMSLQIWDRVGMPEEQASDLVERVQQFETLHRSRVDSASRMYDSFLSGGLVDTSAHNHEFVKLCVDMSRNRLLFGAIDPDAPEFLLQEKLVPPRKRVANDGLSMKNRQLLNQTFLKIYMAAQKASRARANRKSAFATTHVHDEPIIVDDPSEMRLPIKQFADVCRLLGDGMGMNVAPPKEVERLFNLARSVDVLSQAEIDRPWIEPEASLKAFSRAFAITVAALPLVEAKFTNASQHSVEVQWTWNGLPDLKPKDGAWEATPESGLVFVLEIARLNPAFGVMKWQQAAAPTRRLVATTMLSSQNAWEETVEDLNTGEKTPFNCSGSLEDYALRVVAKTRGGESPPSNVVIARPARARKEIVMTIPGPLPPSPVREILDIEDVFRKEEFATGLTAAEQFEALRIGLANHMPDISQLFRMFALTNVPRLQSIYSLSRTQFRGLVVAVMDFHPRPPGEHVIDAIWSRTLNLSTSKLSEMFNKSSRNLLAMRDGDEIGFTQFMSAMLRVANAAYHGHIKGAAAQFEALMEHCILPVHMQVAKIFEYDRFLRSRPAVCVMQEHRAALEAIFDYFASLDATSRHASMHAPTMNVSEWLKTVAAGGYFDVQGSRQSTELALIPLNAIRIFVEVNMDDLQLDVVEMDLVHQSKAEDVADDQDLFSEIVFAEFCLCVGYLMPFSPTVLKASEADKQMTAADLLELFLRDDFLPRYARIELSASPRKGSERPASAAAIPNRSPAAVRGGRPASAAASVRAGEAAILNVMKAKKSKSAEQNAELVTAEDWIKVACRGGPRRGDFTELMGCTYPGQTKRAFGLCLTLLGMQVQNEESGEGSDSQ